MFLFFMLIFNVSAQLIIIVYHYVELFIIAVPVNLLVLPQTAHVTEGRVANVADKWFLIIMNAHVCSQTGASCKHFVTNVTRERSDARMTQFMSVKCKNETESQ